MGTPDGDHPASLMGAMSPGREPSPSAERSAQPGRRRTPRGRVEALELADWRRRVWALYEPVRALQPAARPPAQAAVLGAFRARRDALFRNHPQTPLPREARADFGGLEYFPLDPALRFVCELIPDRPGETAELPVSGGLPLRFRPFGHVLVPLPAGDAQLTVFWLADYAGGIFLPFRDATSGVETYGAGRYLWDSAKGADLGMRGGRLVVDFNYAYNPSCAYDARWACPLAPPENRIDTSIRAGERAYGIHTPGAGPDALPAHRPFPTHARLRQDRARSSLRRGGR